MPIDRLYERRKRHLYVTFAKMAVRFCCTTHARVTETSKPTPVFCRAVGDKFNSRLQGEMKRCHQHFFSLAVGDTSSPLSAVSCVVETSHMVSHVLGSIDVCFRDARYTYLWRKNANGEAVDIINRCHCCTSYFLLAGNLVRAFARFLFLQVTFFVFYMW